ncbi:MAG: bifunctional lysylphosphatidylglycerol synthetase/lysine--tRNA ligase LysX [Candidatus Nanopelagicales bacterium]|jgi:lysyl-tRNA synthetase class 2|nr:bifunctional lysylphosphatidylglycerol synthetase/lysine--tRNA ligase LysX [Candidatus Nanopelagicales bacterium]
MTAMTPTRPEGDPAEAPERPDRPASQPADDRWPDRFAAVAFALSALVVVAAVVPPLRRFFEREDDLVSVLFVPIVPNLVYAALLAALGVGLLRRLRAAWWVMVVWLLALPELGRILAVAAGEATVAVWAGLVIVAGLLVLAIRVKPQFAARGVRGNGWRALAALLLGGTATVLVGAWLTQRYGRAEDFADAAAHVFDSLLGDVGRGLVSLGDGVTSPLWVRAIVGLLGAATVLGAAWLLFRSPAFTKTLDAADEARVRTLLRGFGDEDSLGYFATRRDKGVVWDTDDPATARAGVSYRVFGSVALASGNPVGDPAHWGAAIQQWRSLARANGWSLAVMGAGERGAQAYDDAGLVAFEIGDEAILDMRAFSLNAPGMKPVRQAAHRLQRRGYTTRVSRHSQLDAARFAELESAAGQWRGDGGDERGFSMALGRLGDPLDGDCVLVEARDAEGALRGFLSFVPWGRNGLSLDLMRRDPSADNGLVELMVSSLAERAGAFGVARVSLNFAMFREAFERGAQVGAGPMARLWRESLLLASRNWQLESLYRSNAKYMPDWQPRFICFEYTSDLPRVGLAAGNAEGFLAAPSLALLRSKGAEEGAGSLDRAGEEYAAEVVAQLPAERDALADALSTEGLPEQVRVRRAKLDRLREAGVEPYPVGYPRTHTLAEVRAGAGELPPDSTTGTIVSVTGRILLKRDTGKLSFATLRDGSGDLQVMVSLDGVGAEALEHWKRDIDLGDNVGVTGEVITSKRGELTVKATGFALTSKALRPLPDKHKGLTDPEARVRARHVDLIIRPKAREIAYMRSEIVASVRDSLHRRGFVEVETPMLQLIHGGANARPFETHINAYDMDLYLRIATELHLKRLIVGGMEKVFEIGKQFRNEGADFKHNPEFTSLELYETYGDYHTMRVLTQQIIQEAATAVYGAPVARHTDAEGQVTEYDLSGDWPVKPLTVAVSEALGEEITLDTPVEVLHAHADRLGMQLEPDLSWGFTLEELYGELCEGQTTTPVFYTDFPKENAPLTRTHREHPQLAEKWDLVIFGSEQGTAYSELIDPVDQRERLVAQSLLAAAGDAEAMQVDEDFLSALEYGMPPTGGMGMGIDRLVMNLTGLGIRDTILFPLVKPQG